MKSTVHKIINEVYSNEDISYLELGLSSGINFNSLQIKKKKSVDISSMTNPTFLMSTDDFFKMNNEVFHIIYIDADHEYRQVINDYNNAVNSIVENGVVFLHDLYPPDKNHTQSHLCNDSYKVLNYFIENQYEIIVNLDDYGACSVFTNAKIDLEKFDHSITYEKFIEKNGSYENLCSNFEQFLIKYRSKLSNK